MIDYRKEVLDCGLTVLAHEAWDTPMATVNILYGVGSRNEEPHLTGFAHLFEHLMFGGTPAVPDFDLEVSRLGGESNAFTNCDYTNYYITLPVDGLRRALELEADRMQHLDISERALAVQQQVVTEEYHQRYMNQPYGDVWLQLRPLCFAEGHPYSWPTIGADIRHVGEATLDDVRRFHQRWYCPGNAILAVAAPMHAEEQLALVRECFRMDSRPFSPAVLSYPKKEQGSTLTVRRDVPASAVYIAWPMGGHDDPSFRLCDLLSDVLGNGASSRLQRRLVREAGLMVEADASITGEAGAGLLVLNGKMAPGHTTAEGVEALRREAYALCHEPVSDYELRKVVNKYENTFVFSQYKAQDRAFALCHYTWLGDTGLVNREPDEYRRATREALLEAARATLTVEQENVLFYETER